MGDAAPTTVLIADDHDLFAESVSAFLSTEQSIEVVGRAANGEEALAFLRREGSFAHAPRPDVILLDLNLPRKNGREVLAEIKADAGFRSIPVLVLTSSRDEQDVRASYNLHANCFVTKPGELGQFLAVIQSLESFWLNVATLPCGCGPAVM